MKTNRLLGLALTLAALFPTADAQVMQVLPRLFTQFKLEARADFDFLHYSYVDENDYVWQSSQDAYGLHGCYFNLLIGGNLTEDVSYFFRQRIVAKPGSVSNFDNTDFLYVNYRLNDHWSLRAGKDALAVGGFEYDAPPINVFFFTNYWDNFYCFQPAASVALDLAKGQSFRVQVSNSPYVHYNMPGVSLGKEWAEGLMGYNFFWSGDFGHLKMLYSVNFFQRNDRDFLNYIALGNKLVYDKWDWYVDFIHHNLSADDWGKNFAVVSCANFYLTEGFNIFVKGAYEQNHSEVDMLHFAQTGGSMDCFVEAGHDYSLAGAGFEYRPKACPSLRLHGFLASRTEGFDEEGVRKMEKTLQGNVGVTWDMDMLRLLKK